MMDEGAYWIIGGMIAEVLNREIENRAGKSLVEKEDE
jgi:hypothetical protein